MQNDLDQIRKLIIQAIASEKLLMDKLVLKGGNALSLAHKLYSRTSIDIDFSLKEDFEDLVVAKDQIFTALEDRFSTHGFKIFDLKFSKRPARESKENRWGGYEIEFKLISSAEFDHEHADTRTNRVRAIPVGDPQNSRKFIVQISKNEWVDDFLVLEIDGVPVKVYTLAMIAIEKLRALCQQMAEYEHARSTGPRARDFFDIFQIDQRQPLNLDRSDRQELVLAIFQTKEVPLRVLERLEEYKNFHEADWPSVRASVLGPIEPFDFYFNFVLGQAEKLKPLWDK